MRYRPTVPPEPRFWAKVNKEGPFPDPIKYPTLKNRCWLWTGAKRKSGHGYFYVERAPTSPHRYSYELHHGAFDASLSVLHKCDRGDCTNPEHLFLGTQQDNVADAKDKGRMQKGEDRYNAILTPEKVLEIRSLYASGQTTKELMARLNLGRSVLSHIVNKTRWKHL